MVRFLELVEKEDHTATV